MGKGEGQGQGAGEGQGQGSGRGGLCPGLLWGVVWFLILIFLGWPVGFFVAWWYIFLLPFGACIDPIKEACEVLLRLVQLPLTCAENMVAMKPLCN